MIYIINWVIYNQNILNDLRFNSFAKRDMYSVEAFKENLKYLLKLIGRNDTWLEFEHWLVILARWWGNTRRNRYID